MVIAAALAVVVVVCALLTGALAWHAAIATANRIMVAHESSAATSSVQATLARDDDLVRAAAQGVGSGALDATEFHSFALGLDLAHRYPGIFGVGFIAYLPGGAPGADGSSFSCVGQVAEWVSGAQPIPLVGYDFCSVPWLRQDLIRSAARGAEAVVPEATLGPGYRSDFVLLAPSYRSPASDGPGRLASLTGWGATLIDGRRLLTTVTRHAYEHVNLSLFSAATAVPADLAATAGRPAIAVIGSDVTTLSARPPWTLRTDVLRGTPGLGNTWLFPLLFFLVGLWFALSLAGVVLRLARSRTAAWERARHSETVSRQEVMRFDSLAEASPVGILETTGDLRVTYVNRKLQAMSGRDRSALVETGWIDCLHEQDRAPFMMAARTAASRRGAMDTTVRIVRPSGEIRTLHLRTAGLHFDDDARVARYVATVEDVTEELAMQDRLRHQALHDPLTGLPNRVVFLDHLDQALRQARRGGGGPAVLYFDIDRFKVVNDGLGHDVGDQLLKAVAERMGGVARAGETLARIGGDEFALLLPRVGGLDQANVVAQRILRGLEESFRVAGHDLVASVSIGIVLPRLDDEPTAVLRNADAAMYRAKEEGRGRAAVFDDSLYRRSLSRLTLEGELRHALEHEELVVFYQPVVDLGSGSVTGAEALVRWRHPTRGLLAPGEFIGLAEETGLVVPMGQWVFGEAVRQLHAWDEAGELPGPITMAVNFAARQLRDRELSMTRKGLLGRFDIEPQRLCAEITESVAMDDNAETRSTLARMDADGVKVAIDDFGTGYSSLAYLQSLPVSILKIDKRFVAGVGTDESSDAIVAAVVEMAHRLGLQTVAEGIETELQLARMREFRCDGAQGFLWTPPLPPAEFAAWCRRQEPGLVLAQTVGTPVA